MHFFFLKFTFGARPLKVKRRNTDRMIICKKNALLEKKKWWECSNAVPTNPLELSTPRRLNILSLLLSSCSFLFFQFQQFHPPDIEYPDGARALNLVISCLKLNPLTSPIQSLAAPKESSAILYIIFFCFKSNSIPIQCSNSFHIPYQSHPE